jgi:hypothetical protein
MADIVVSGNSSGSVTLRAPDVSGSTILTLPTSSGTLVVTGGAQTIEFAAGSAGAPSITFTGDTNTGIYSPAADTIAFTEGGVESMRIDSAGNVGIGVTPSAWGVFKAIQVSTIGSVFSADFGSGNTQTRYGSNIYYDGANFKYMTSNPIAMYTQNGSQHIWAYAASGTANANVTPTEAMRIDSSGNVGIGTTVAPGPNGGGLAIYRSDYPRLTFRNSTTGDTTSDGSTMYQIGNNFEFVNLEAGYFSVATSNTERMRIDSSGNLLVGTTANVGRLGVAGNIVKITSSGFDGTFDNIIKYGTASDLSSGTAQANRWVGIDGTITAGASVSNVVRIRAYPGGSGNAAPVNVADFRGDQSVVVYGSLSKGSGSFRIDHPLPELEETHQLVHSFIEGPQADLIYRGVVELVAGKATINIDSAAGMTEGTFEALCREVQCFTTNESDWIAVRGKVSGNILTIEAQDKTATSSISWMIIGERKDKHMYDTGWTDENGKVIVEPLKTTASENT